MIGVVLAGGSSKRIGVDKLFYPIKGKPLVLYLIEQLSRVKDIVKVVVVSSGWNADKFAEIGVDTIVDTLLIGPMGAIYLALRRYQEIVAVAGDMPFLSYATLRNLISLCEEGYDVCVPIWSNGYIEPLCTVYRQSFLEILEYGLREGILALHKLVSLAKALKISIDRISSNPEVEFYNVNSFESLLKTRTLIEVVKLNSMGARLHL